MVLDSLMKFQFSANRAIVRVACLNPKIWWFGRIAYALWSFAFERKRLGRNLWRLSWLVILLKF